MLSIGLLDRAEKLVNVPNRLLLDNLPKGTAVIVHHQGWAADRDGRVNNGYPGLVATFAYGLPDPKRSAWTLDHMLQLYKGIVLGTACRTLPDGKIVVLFQGAARGVFDADSVLALGLPDPYSSMPTRIDLSEVCTPAD
jgi:hypothetical protein